MLTHSFWVAKVCMFYMAHHLLWSLWWYLFSLCVVRFGSRHFGALLLLCPLLHHLILVLLLLIHQHPVWPPLLSLLSQKTLISPVQMVSMRRTGPSWCPGWRDRARRSGWKSVWRVTRFLVLPTSLIWDISMAIIFFWMLRFRSYWMVLWWYFALTFVMLTCPSVDIWRLFCGCH